MATTTLLLFFQLTFQSKDRIEKPPLMLLPLLIGNYRTRKQPARESGVANFEKTSSHSFALRSSLENWKIGLILVSGGAGPIVLVRRGPPHLTFTPQNNHSLGAP